MFTLAGALSCGVWYIYLPMHGNTVSGEDYDMKWPAEIALLVGNNL